MLVSGRCLLCDALAACIEREDLISVVRRNDVAETMVLGLMAEVDAVLVCAIQEGPPTVQRLRRGGPSLPIVACGLKEEEEAVITWAEVGVSGYIASTTKLSEFVETLRAILRGEQLSSPRIVGALLRRFSVAPPHPGLMPTRKQHTLTRRERQIAELIAAERNDKEIARLLNISLATTKFHVHNLLRKLGVRRRSEVVDFLPVPAAKQYLQQMQPEVDSPGQAS